MTATEEPLAQRMALSDEFDSFQFVLDDEVAPLPSSRCFAAARAPLAVLPQAPDKLTVLEDEPLSAALESIDHFKSVIDVASLRKLYA